MAHISGSHYISVRHRCSKQKRRALKYWCAPLWWYLLPEPWKTFLIVWDSQPSVLQHALCIYCCVTNYSVFSDFKQQTLIISQFLRVRSLGATGAVVLAQGLVRF